MHGFIISIASAQLSCPKGIIYALNAVSIIFKAISHHKDIVSIVMWRWRCGVFFLLTGSHELKVDVVVRFNCLINLVKSIIYKSLRKTLSCGKPSLNIYMRITPCHAIPHHTLPNKTNVCECVFGGACSTVYPNVFAIHIHLYFK